MRSDRSETSLALALGVLVAVSLIQVVTAYCDAGPGSIQTILGAGFLAAGMLGLWKLRCGRRESWRTTDSASSPTRIATPTGSNKWP